MLQLLGMNALGLGLGGGFLARTEAAERGVAAPLSPLNRFPRMVQEYFVERLRAMESANVQAKAALKTKADAEKFLKDLARETGAKGFVTSTH